MSHTNVSCTQFFPLTHKFLYAEKIILYANDIAHHQWRARNNNHDMKKKKKKKQHSLCVTPISLPIIHLFYHKDILKSRSINTTSYQKKKKDWSWTNYNSTWTLKIRSNNMHLHSIHKSHPCHKKTSIESFSSCISFHTHYTHFIVNDLSIRGSLLFQKKNLFFKMNV
jgi:hypothetical protein